MAGTKLSPPITLRPQPRSQLRLNRDLSCALTTAAARLSLLHRGRGSCWLRCLLLRLLRLHQLRLALLDAR